jgi:tRNA dimethylallyltransferase
VAAGKLIAIVGPTASGKSDLAMEIARRFNGEIIAADSRTVYRGLDIATAKPSKVDQKEIPHHLIDIVDPDQKFTVADFKRLALNSIDDILMRGKVPVLVGGTGLYIDAVLYDYRFPERKTQDFSDLSDDELRSKVDLLGIELNPSDRGNRRRLVSAIESADQPRSKKDLRPDSLIIGLKIDRTMLLQRINRRIERWLHEGLVQEVAQARIRYTSGLPALTAMGYADFFEMLNGKISEAEATKRLRQKHMQLARRQMTWFKRNPDIQWIRAPQEGLELAAKFFKAGL